MQPRDEDLIEIFPMVGSDRVMFSTDYPHWDMAEPAFVFSKPKIEEADRARITGGNARQLSGQSWCDPATTRVQMFEANVENGEALAERPYVDKTFPVAVEDDYMVVEVWRRQWVAHTTGSDCRCPATIVTYSAFGLPRSITERAHKDGDPDD